jgi:hypothetical protein
MMHSYHVVIVVEHNGLKTDHYMLLLLDVFHLNIGKKIELQEDEDYGDRKCPEYRLTVHIKSFWFTGKQTILRLK